MYRWETGLAHGSLTLFISHFTNKQTDWLIDQCQSVVWNQLLKQVGYYTHGVHFRFPSKAQLDSFLESPVVQKVSEPHPLPKYLVCWNVFRFISFCFSRVFFFWFFLVAKLLRQTDPNLSTMKMQEDELRPDRCPGTAVVSFESSLPEDLFAIFRKGQDWDEGKNSWFSTNFPDSA